MRATLQRYHVYAGLLSSVGILVYGLTAVYATFEPGPGGFVAERSKERRALNVRVEGDADAKAVAKAVARELSFPLSQGPWEITEEAGVVSMVFASPNAQRAVRYDRARRQAVIETAPVTFASFAIKMHQARIRPGLPTRVLLWAAFNMVSAAALLFMVVTGLYLFATAKRRPWYAWAAVAIGVVTLAPLPMLLR